MRTNENTMLVLDNEIVYLMAIQQHTDAPWLYEVVYEVWDDVTLSHQTMLDTVDTQYLLDTQAYYSVSELTWDEYHNDFRPSITRPIAHADALVEYANNTIAWDRHLGFVEQSASTVWNAGTHSIDSDLVELPDDEPMPW